MIKEIEDFLAVPRTQEDYIEFTSSLVDLCVIEALQETDFFTAPAATMHHDAHPMGLIKHSLKVLMWAQKLKALLLPDGGANHTLYQKELVIAALLHDLCKVNLYEQTTRNVKKNGVWTQEPYYKWKDQAYLGHGTESLLRARAIWGAFNFPAWEVAIRWHMGPFELNKEDQHWYSCSNQTHPEILLLHTADMCAVYR